MTAEAAKPLAQLPKADKDAGPRASAETGKALILSERDKARALKAAVRAYENARKEFNKAGGE